MTEWMSWFDKHVEAAKKDPCNCEEMFREAAEVYNITGSKGEEND